MRPFQNRELFVYGIILSVFLSPLFVSAQQADTSLNKECPKESEDAKYGKPGEKLTKDVTTTSTNEDGEKVTTTEKKPIKNLTGTPCQNNEVEGSCVKEGGTIRCSAAGSTGKCNIGGTFQPCEKPTGSGTNGTGGSTSDSTGGTAPTLPPPTTSAEAGQRIDALNEQYKAIENPTDAQKQQYDAQLQNLQQQQSTLSRIEQIAQMPDAQKNSPEVQGELTQLQTNLSGLQGQAVALQPGANPPAGSGNSTGASVPGAPTGDTTFKSNDQTVSPPDNSVLGTIKNWFSTNVATPVGNAFTDAKNALVDSYNAANQTPDATPPNYVLSRDPALSDDEWKQQVKDTFSNAQSLGTCVNCVVVLGKNSIAVFDGGGTSVGTGVITTGGNYGWINAVSGTEEDLAANIGSTLATNGSVKAVGLSLDPATAQGIGNFLSADYSDTSLLTRGIDTYNDAPGLRAGYVPLAPQDTTFETVPMSELPDAVKEAVTNANPDASVNKTETPQPPTTPDFTGAPVEKVDKLPLADVTPNPTTNPAEEPSENPPSTNNPLDSSKNQTPPENNDSKLPDTTKTASNQPAGQNNAPPGQSSSGQKATGGQPATQPTSPQPQTQPSPQPAPQPSPQPAPQSSLPQLAQALPLSAWAPAPLPPAPPAPVPSTSPNNATPIAGQPEKGDASLCTGAAPSCISPATLVCTSAGQWQCVTPAQNPGPGVSAGTPQGSPQTAPCLTLSCSITQQVKNLKDSLIAAGDKIANVVGPNSANAEPAPNPNLEQINNLQGQMAKVVGDINGLKTSEGKAGQALQDLKTSKANSDAAYQAKQYGQIIAYGTQGMAAAKTLVQSLGDVANRTGDSSLKSAVNDLSTRQAQLQQRVGQAQAAYNAYGTPGLLPYQDLATSIPQFVNDATNVTNRASTGANNQVNKLTKQAEAINNQMKQLVPQNNTLPAFAGAAPATPLPQPAIVPRIIGASPVKLGNPVSPTNPNVPLPTPQNPNVPPQLQPPPAPKPAIVQNRPGPYNPASGQQLADAINLACKVQQCNAPLMQKAFGGVCAIESLCDAGHPHPGSKYQGFGQLGWAETGSSINALYKASQSPNLSPAEQAQMRSAADAARRLGINAPADANVGPWLLIGRHLEIGSMPKVSAITNDPRTAAAYLQNGQLAPATFIKNQPFTPNTPFGFAEAKAYSDQGWMGWVAPGTTVGQAAALMLSTKVVSKVDDGIQFMSQFQPSSSPAPVFAAGAGAYAVSSSVPPPPGGWRGTPPGNPSIAPGNPGYAPGIVRIAPPASSAQAQTKIESVPNTPGPVAFVVPAGFDPSKPAQVVYYLHGNGGSVNDSLGRQQVADQLAKSGCNCALVVPDLGTSPQTTSGALGTTPGFRAFDGEVNAKLAQMTGQSADKIAALPRTVVAYSAGYYPASAALDALGGKVTGVQNMLQGNYSKFTDAVQNWRTQNPKGTYDVVNSGPHNDLVQNGAPITRMLAANGPKLPAGNSPTGLHYCDAQTGACGAPSDPNMSSADFQRAAKADVALERLAQQGKLAQGTRAGLFTATPNGTAPQPISQQDMQKKVDDYLFSHFNPASMPKATLAAQHAGMGVEQFVIGGMDKNLKTNLYFAGQAMDQAGVPWKMNNGFRDDYYQSLVCAGETGPCAPPGRSFHGNSGVTGGYGHGMAVDIMAGPGQDWMRANSQRFGLAHPFSPGYDLPHYVPMNSPEYLMRNSPSGNYQSILAQQQGQLASSMVPTQMYTLAGADGKPVLDASGNPVSVPLPQDSVGPDGKVMLGTDESGKPLLDSTGKPTLNLSDPRATPTGTVSPDGQTVQFNDDRPTPPPPANPWPRGGNGNPFYGYGGYNGAGGYPGGSGYPGAGGYPQQPPPPPPPMSSLPPTQPSNGTGNGQQNPIMTQLLTPELSCSLQSATSTISIRWLCLAGQPYTAGFDTGGHVAGETTVPARDEIAQSFSLWCIANGEVGPEASCSIAATSTAATSTPVVSVIANPGAIRSGESANISWASLNTTGCLIAMPGSEYATSSKGSVATPPLTETTDFTASCTGLNGQEVVATTTVIVQ